MTALLEVCENPYYEPLPWLMIIHFWVGGKKKDYSLYACKNSTYKIVVAIHMT